MFCMHEWYGLKEWNVWFVMKEGNVQYGIKEEKERSEFVVCMYGME